MGKSPLHFNTQQAIRNDHYLLFSKKPVSPLIYNSENTEVIYAGFTGLEKRHEF